MKKIRKFAASIFTFVLAAALVFGSFGTVRVSAKATLIDPQKHGQGPAIVEKEEKEKKEKEEKEKKEREEKEKKDKEEKEKKPEGPKPEAPKPEGPKPADVHYTVIFRDYDGSETKRDVKEGETVKVKDIPAAKLAGTSKNGVSISFNGWKAEGEYTCTDAVNCDMTFTAQYTVSLTMNFFVQKEGVEITDGTTSVYLDSKSSALFTTDVLSTTSDTVDVTALSDLAGFVDGTYAKLIQGPADFSKLSGLTAPTLKNADEGASVNWYVFKLEDNKTSWHCDGKMTVYVEDVEEYTGETEDEPVVPDEPVVEEPEVEEPVVEEPEEEEPVVEELAHEEEPAPEEEQPVVEELEEEEPEVEEPEEEEPATEEQPEEEEPATEEQPEEEEPATEEQPEEEEPATEEQPVEEEPVVIDTPDDQPVVVEEPDDEPAAPAEEPAEEPAAPYIPIISGPVAEEPEETTEVIEIEVPETPEGAVEPEIEVPVAEEPAAPEAEVPAEPEVEAPVAEEPEETIEVEIPETPEGAAEPEVEEPEVEEPAEELEIEMPETPQGSLPQTGTAAVVTFYALGAGFIALGGTVAVKASRKNEENE